MKKKLGAALLGICLSLIVAEVGLRWISCYSTNLRFFCSVNQVSRDLESRSSLGELMSAAPSPVGPYEISNGFVLNSRGFRTPEYTRSPKQGSRRIVVLGDSIVFDSGPVPYHQHFTRLLESGLTEKSAMPVEVINLGVPNTGPGFYKELFRIEVSELQPDLILWCFNIQNDFFDKYLDFHLDAPTKAATASFQHSYLYCFIRNSRIYLNYSRSKEGRQIITMMNSIEVPDGAHPGGVLLGESMPYDPEQPAMSYETFIQLMKEIMPQYQKGVFDDLPADLAWRWQRYQSIFKEIDSECRSRNIVLFVLLIPAEIQIDPALATTVIRESALDPANLDLLQPQRILQEFLSRQGINHLDLLPAFQRNADGPRLFNLQETHWSAVGNAVAATELIPVLAEILEKHQRK